MGKALESMQKQLLTPAPSLNQLGTELMLFIKLIFSDRFWLMVVAGQSIYLIGLIFSGLYLSKGITAMLSVGLFLLLLFAVSAVGEYNRTKFMDLRAYFRPAMSLKFWALLLMSTLLQVLVSAVLLFFAGTWIHQWIGVTIGVLWLLESCYWMVSLMYLAQGCTLRASYGRALSVLYSNRLIRLVERSVVGMAPVLAFSLLLLIVLKGAPNVVGLFIEALWLGLVFMIVAFILGTSLD